MATNGEYPTTSDDDESVDDEKTTSGSFRNGDFQGRLSKWTNYLHGWQERYLILKQGFLNYYKNAYDIGLGCRGALSVKQAIIQAHEFDECRFDIRVSDSVWYLRANDSDDRERWIQALEDHKQICISESGYGSETSLRRHPSIGSLASTASVSATSTGSFKKDRNLKEKLDELETYRELLAQQVSTLQTYFDACANAVTTGFEPYQREYENVHHPDLEDSTEHPHSPPIESEPPKLRIDRLALTDHAGMAIDFKGEALTFKATTDGVIHNLAFSIELIQKREDVWRMKYDRELERRKKYQELCARISHDKATAFGSPDVEEGPRSTLKEDEFFDAIDQSLDRIDRETDSHQRSSTNNKSHKTSRKHSNDLVSLSDKDKHRLSDEIERTVQEHLHYVREDVSCGWDLIHQEGEMKVYRREVEENGIVVDPLKSFHTIRGVTGHEICRYFWEIQYRMDWDATLDSTKIIETLDSDTVIFYQVHKRVWPAAQRDSCFWSHIRSISHSDEDQPTWLVVNYTTPHALAPIKSPQVRLVANVALMCETIIHEPPLNPKDIKRENIQCKLTYVAFVNPGGWVPSAALRGVAKREYPRFLKRFTSYVVEQTRDKPILF